MRALPALLAVLLLAGCLGAPAAQEPPPGDAGDITTPVDAGPAPSPPPPRAPPGNATQAVLPAAVPAPAPKPFDAGPVAVIAHIDTGINPYHAAFRDASPLARVHPCLYLPGYPCNVTALNLTLDDANLDDALQRDAQVWAGVKPGVLYWIPGTRIVGAISFGAGGTACDAGLVQAATDPTQPQLPVPLPVPAPQVLPSAPVCAEHPILDDHGHGTMTASRMAGGEHSLCPTCRIVSIEGLGAASVRWAAAQGWIDVQTDSWGDLVPGVVPFVDAGAASVGASDIRTAFADAAKKMLVFAASGNGIAFQGGVGDETLLQATGAQGVVLVGAHDNGYLTLYQGMPPHVVADGFGGWHATRNSTADYVADGVACCTSAASPYAAGGAAAMLLAARTLEDARGSGWHDGVGAAGSWKAAAGPLQDGKLTLDELRMLLLRTAEARPSEGPDDGVRHTLADLQPPSDLKNPGENPYCVLCVTFPVRWQDLPPDVPLVQVVGYGSVSPASLGVARAALRGEVPVPDRGAEDAWFGLDQQARGAVDALASLG
jgi:hypothetical protein